MITLICPVRRKIATDVGGHAEVLCELVNWSGVALMLHRHVHAGRILGGPEWSCSHEPTGRAIAHGPSPETALARAIEILRANGLAVVHKLTSDLPVLNPLGGKRSEFDDGNDYPGGAEAAIDRGEGGFQDQGEPGPGL